MSPSLKLLWSVAVSVGFLQAACGQELAPRAYVITPLGSNAVILTYAYFTGSVLFDGALPITGATGKYSVPVFTYYHAFNFFGRSANASASLPYAVGTFQGQLVGQQRQVYRSGLGDSAFRLAVNLKGGPAMPLQQYARWKQKMLLGASLKVTVPTGQYDATKLINWGSNRWAFKPEVGYSQRFGHWVLDAYGGAWLYTKNTQSYSIPLPEPQTESPVGSFEGHLSRDFKPRLWVSIDGNFWFGGIATLNGLTNPATRQTSSRIGATASFPLGKHNSIKASYSNGTYVRFGGNYQTVAVAWQYSWIGHPN
jgi:hypothetical protein